VRRDLELIGVEESVALFQGRWRKIIARSDPYLKIKYGLKAMMMMMMTLNPLSLFGHHIVQLIKTYLKNISLNITKT